HVDVLNSHSGNLESPSLDVFFDMVLDRLGDLLPLGQELIERHLADDIAQRGLRVLSDHVTIVLDHDDRFGGVIDPKEEHTVDRDRYVISSDDLLLRNIYGQHAGINHLDLIDQGKDAEEPRPLHAMELSEAKDDGFFPLGGKSDR